MNNVIIDGKTYEIVKDATDDIETVYNENDTLQNLPILAVTGVGRSVETGDLYEIVWHLDEQNASLLSDDASDWVTDWGTADEAIELDE